MSETSATQLYGFPALFEELEEQGVRAQDVLKRAGISEQRASLQQSERMAIFRAARDLAIKPETALLAGQRQKISYYGVYGYALASSATIADAFKASSSFFGLSGSVLRISFQVEGRVGIFRSHQPGSLGDILPFVAEYWRSSQSRLQSLVLGRPFPSSHMYFPYPRPPYGALHQELLGCPVTFNADRMEWHFDASVLAEPCSNADTDTARLCADYCERFVARSGSLSGLQSEIVRACVPILSQGASAKQVAYSLGMSLRTLYRRLQQEGVTYQSLINKTRASVAKEFLQNTRLPIEEVALRCGYNDASNFRKAFKNWTGLPPSSYRSR